MKSEETFTPEEVQALKELARRKSEIEDTINKANQLQQIVSSLETRVTSLSSKITTIEGKISNLQSTLNNLSGRTDALAQDINSISTDVSNLKSTVSDLNNQVSSIQSDVSGLQSSVSDINKQIGDIQSTIQTINSDLTDIQSSISDINSQIENIKNDIITTGENVKSELKDWVTNVEIPNVKSEIMDWVNNTALPNIKSDIESWVNENVIKPLNELKQEFEDTIGKLTNEAIQYMQSFFNTIKDRLNAFKDAWNNTVQTLASYINDVKNAIQKLNDKANEINDRLDGDASPIVNGVSMDVKFWIDKANEAMNRPFVGPMEVLPYITMSLVSLVPLTVKVAEFVQNVRDTVNTLSDTLTETINTIGSSITTIMDFGDILPDSKVYGINSTDLSLVNITAPSFTPIITHGYINVKVDLDGYPSSGDIYVDGSYQGTSYDLTVKVNSGTRTVTVYMTIGSVTKSQTKTVTVGVGDTVTVEFSFSYSDFSGSATEPYVPGGYITPK